MEKTFHAEVRVPKGIHVSRWEESCPVVRERTSADVRQTETFQPDDSSSWCYLFVHHAKASIFMDRLGRDGIRHFVHRTVTYRRRKHSRGIQPVEKPTIGGLIFLQGTPGRLQGYLDVSFPGHYLVKNCSTHLPAVVPDSVMRPFMRMSEISPERIRFLLHPFKYYAGGNVKLRITSGFLAGVEGYVIRIDRDRRLVMDVGGMSVAISGIHCEKFEVV